MTFPEILEYTRERLRKPWVWVGALVVFAPTSALSYLQAPKGLKGPLLGAYALGENLAQVAILAWVAPWAWLWTGRLLDFPRWWRGLLQALLLGWICLLPIHLLQTYVSRLWPTAEVTEILPGGRMSIYIPNIETRSWRDLFHRNMALTIPLFCLVGLVAVALDRSERRRIEAEQEAQEARWILLRGQLNPHVFFNAMNNLTALIQEDSKKAVRAALDLTDLFRRLMEHGHSPLASLLEERRLVEKFLAVESLRLAARMHVSWDWEPALDKVQAPPFLLQPLVENAIKHGLSPHPEGGELRISGHIEGECAVLRVVNTGRPLTMRTEGGLGLRNLESRLHLAFEEEGQFELRNEEGSTVAEVSFPLPKEWS